MIHFITYGDSKYANAKNKLWTDATITGWFDTITMYGPDDLDINFKKQFSSILKENKGGGYWIWKPYYKKTFR